MTRSVTASAPGSIMVTGEHAVVYGHPAMVAGIEQRASVSGTMRQDGLVTITSQIADPYCGPLDQIQIDGPYRFVLAALSEYRDALAAGLDIEIRSEIDPTLGLGSSAAVTIATLGALATLAGRSLDDLHARALRIVRHLQGRGSGADLAASLHGGLLSYQLSGDGAEIRSLPAPPPLGLRYVGYKTPTGEVLAKVAKDTEGREAEVAALYAEMGESASRAIKAASAEDWESLGNALTTYQTHMTALGVSDANLDAIVTEASGTSGLLAAKISGSGLGDCVLAIGAVPAGFTPVTCAQKGLVIHDNA